MEKRNIQSQWKSLIDNLDLRQVNAISQSIQNSLELAISDAEKENQNILEKLNGDNNLVELHKLIIKRKTNFLKSKTSDYSILHKSYGSFLRTMYGDDSEKTSKVTLLFFMIFKIDLLFDFEDFNRQIKEEVYSYKKDEILYLSCINIIDYFNHNIKTRIKLPLIDNFEINSYQELYLQKNDISSEYDALVKIYNKEVTNLSEEKCSISEKLNDKIWELEKKIRSLDSNIYGLKYENREIKSDLKFCRNYSEILRKKVIEKDYLLNPQFVNLYWGDNYPALKVLFDFLQKNRIYQSSWSYFAQQMSIGDLSIIQFYTGNYNKREIGYMFSKMKPFFTNEFKNSQKRFLIFIQRKFAVDEIFIDDNFCKNNIRTYNKSKDVIKPKHEIDFLCANIASRYF
jgi:hypothetical protein